MMLHFNRWRRNAIAGSVLLCLALATGANAATDPQMPSVCVVRDGQPNAVIVIPVNTPAEVPTYKHPLFIEFGLMTSNARVAAELLARYVRESTGADLPIVTDDQIPAGSNAIHVGRTTLAQEMMSDVVTLDDDGFLIAVPNTSTVILLGATPMGTEFAVYDLLERTLGVRWLFAGDLGEHVPPHQNVWVSGPNRTSQPVFTSRILYVRGANGYIDGSIPWARRNRAHSRIEFHHNISKLVPVSWTKSNPEFFPLEGDKRRLPKRMNQADWHLCYSADGVANAVADLIESNLKKYPQYGSVSLGASDGGEDAYCHCANCLTIRRGVGLNSLGYNNYADEYYQWCSDVLSRVTKSHPDMLFGCLAYREIVDPPSFPVHDNLVPYLTFELLQWADPLRREGWKKQVHAWSAKAKHFGHYEYMFGEDHMLVPRIYLHAISDYCRFAAGQGATGFYAETTGMNIRTMWYAGPQPYILMRVLWDPNADVDALLTDWCVATVGADAAPFLEKYFRYWEHVWTQRVPQTKWFGTESQLYLKFNSDEYLEAVRTEDLTTCEAYLVAAAERAGEGKTRERADMFLAEFRKRRTEKLDYQVAVWDAQRFVGKREAEKPVYHQSFEKAPKDWTQFSPNDTAQATHDAKQGALRFTANSSIVGPSINLQPDSAYVVTWQMRSDEADELAKVTILMRANPAEKSEADYEMNRNLIGTAFDGKGQTLQYAFRTKASKGSTVQVQPLFLVRGMHHGALMFEGFTIAPLDVP